MGKRKDLVGKRFSRLFVIRECEFRNRFGHVMWECLCDCGTSVVASTSSLTCKDRTSCGCRRKEIDEKGVERHGFCSGGLKQPTYNSWQSMKSRCRNPKETGYEYYGGRGITYDPEWELFENFYRDMGERPEGMTLDRIDVNGNYCKENCRWATNETQGRNKRIRKDSIYPGVTFNFSNNNWRVRMFHDKKNVEIGQFDDLLDAICAKMNYERKIRNVAN